MTRGDRLIEGAADRLEETAERLAGGDGLKAKAAAELAEDAQFLRKLKPSLIAARARGGQPEEPAATKEPPPPPPRPSGTGPSPSPLLLAAAAFAVGVLIAKVIDWRSHAHPRD